MKVLVTGATGFLGRHLCRQLRESGQEIFEVSSKSCDLTRADSLKQFENHSFDRIYHLAAWTQAGDFCLHHPGEQWIINQKINLHVLDWWATRQPQAKMIAMGTSCGYDPSLPLEEAYYLEGKPIESLFTYAMTKRMLLNGLMALSQQFGLQYLYLIPSTLYGTGYHEDGRQMHFIFDLVRKIVRGKLFGESVILWGDGYQKRELIHVGDFLGAMKALASYGPNLYLNVGGGKEHTIREFAEEICRQVGYPSSQIQYDTSKYVGAKSKILNIQKLQTLLPAFRPRPLAGGLQEVVGMFLDRFQAAAPR